MGTDRPPVQRVRRARAAVRERRRHHGGGNPIWKCADCGKSAAAMGPEVLCWCGYSHKHNHNATAYVCQPFTVLETKPELLAAFQACGCDPKRGGEVGIMLERDLQAVMRGAP